MSPMTEIAEFTFSYDGVVKLLLPKGRRARVEVSDQDVYVYFGSSFTARIPLSSVRQVGPIPPEWVGMTRGVHGGHGAWLVNGSNRGLVRLILDPPATAQTKYRTAEVRELRLSLDDPDGLIERVKAVTGVS